MTDRPAVGPRSLMCGHCGAPFDAPEGGGRARCEFCGSTTELAARVLGKLHFPDPTLSPDSTPEQREAARHELLATQAADYDPKLSPYAYDRPPPLRGRVTTLPVRHEAAPAELQAAFLAEVARCSTSRHCLADERPVWWLAKRLGHAFSLRDETRRADAATETAWELVVDPGFKQLLTCGLAVDCAGRGDLGAADAWLGLCDPRPAILELDSTYRSTRGRLLLHAGQLDEALDVVGATAGAIPFAPSQVAVLMAVRVAALQRLGRGADAESALTWLVERIDDRQWLRDFIGEKSEWEACRAVWQRAVPQTGEHGRGDGPTPRRRRDRGLSRAAREAREAAARDARSSPAPRWERGEELPSRPPVRPPSAASVAWRGRLLLCRECGGPLEVPKELGKTRCQFCGTEQHVGGVRTDVSHLPHAELDGIADPERRERRRRELLTAEERDYDWSSNRFSNPALPHGFEYLAEMEYDFALLPPLLLQACLRAAQLCEESGGSDADQRALYVLTEKLEYLMVSRHERRCAGGAIETALALLTDTGYVYDLVCSRANLARDAGDLDAAEAWLALCDPRPPLLDLDSTYRASLGKVLLERGRHAGVLDLVGERHGQIPRGPQQHFALSLLRTCALLGLRRRRDAEVELALAFSAADPDIRHQVWPLMRNGRLWAACLPLARRLAKQGKVPPDEDGGDELVGDPTVGASRLVAPVLAASSLVLAVAAVVVGGFATWALGATAAVSLLTAGALVLRRRFAA